ncbi:MULTISPECIES: YkgJ family cysteine cluster protein [Paraburkholderia]|uniref:YkgJ family cysteine cluster protein n=1 Tax=Paraburkholderia TaxID=1822464 RepID=UPI0009F4CF97|nr:YkgJ family cysteine cluster protein [Paraburkholderia fungorum]
MTKRASPFDSADHACRPDCGACCIAPSISSPIPGMPHGKPAGVRCVQLGDDLRCAIFGQPERPACCSGLQPQTEMCGSNRTEALAWLTQLEVMTRPQSGQVAAGQ